MSRGCLRAVFFFFAVPLVGLLSVTLPCQAYFYFNTVKPVLSGHSKRRQKIGCCQAHRGLPVGFLLLQYSVLFTVESRSLLYLLFIS